MGIELCDTDYGPYGVLDFSYVAIEAVYDCEQCSSGERGAR